MGIIMAQYPMVIQLIISMGSLGFIEGAYGPVCASICYP